MKRSLPLIFAALMLLLPSTSLAQFYGPNGNGTLEHEDDLKWVFFHDAKITADNKRGVYTAKFGPDLAKMEGAQFSITGYMMLIESKNHIDPFPDYSSNVGLPILSPQRTHRSDGSDNDKALCLHTITDHRLRSAASCWRKRRRLVLSA